MKRSEELPSFENETARKKKHTSVVWETFSPVSSSGARDGVVDSAKCNVCNKVFSTRHGTSSMMRHAKRHSDSPSGAASAKKPKKSSASASLVNNGSSSSSNSVKKSPVLKKTAAADSPTLDETSAGVKRQRLRTLTGSLVEWLVADRIDPNVVTHDTFLDVLAALTATGANTTRPSALLPPPDALRKTLERTYFSLFARVSEYVGRSAIGRVAFSCDTWSQRVPKGFVAVHVHWINAEWEAKTLQIALESCPADASASFVADLLYTVLQHTWGLGSKVLCGVTPATGDAVVGMNFLREKAKVLLGLDLQSPHWHVPCLGHCLHIGVRAALREVRHEIGKLRSLLALLRATTEAHEHFVVRTAAEIALSPFSNSSSGNNSNSTADAVLPAMDVPTNWHSTLAMVLASVKQRDAIATLCSDAASSGLGIFVFEAIEWDLLLAVATFLTKCVLLATCQSAQRPISLSTSTNVCKAIVSHCESTAAAAAATNSAFSALAASKLTAVCVKVQRSLEPFDSALASSPYFALAKILDPRFANESVEKAGKMDFLRAMLRAKQLDDVALQRSTNDHHSDLQHHEASATTVAYSSTFDKLLDIGEGITEDNALDGDEVDRFFDATLMRDKRSDPLLWWKSNATRFPALAKLARDVLAIPATAVVSGAVFTQSTHAHALHTDTTTASPSLDAAKLFKYTELARAWQLERQSFGRKRRRDSFDFSDALLEPPSSKLASYEESI